MDSGGSERLTEPFGRQRLHEVEVETRIRRPQAVRGLGGGNGKLLGGRVCAGGSTPAGGAGGSSDSFSHVGV